MPPFLFLGRGGFLVWTVVFVWWALIIVSVISVFTSTPDHRFGHLHFHAIT